MIDSLDETVDRYADMVYRMAYAKTMNKHDADDIFQEVFLRYIRKKPHFNSEEHAKAWFLKVCANCSKSFFSMPFRKRTSELKQEIIFEDKQMDQMQYYLIKLHAKERIMIHLFYYEGYTAKQISVLLDLKESTVRMRLKRTREKLKVMMEGDE